MNPMSTTPREYLAENGDTEDKDEGGRMRDENPPAPVPAPAPAPAPDPVFDHFDEGPDSGRT